MKLEICLRYNNITTRGAVVCNNFSNELLTRGISHYSVIYFK